MAKTNTISQAADRTHLIKGVKQIFLGYIALAVGLLSAKAADPAQVSTGTSLSQGSTLAVETFDLSDRHFRLEGRFDRTSPKDVVMIWQCTSVSVDFKSPTLKLNFGSPEAQSFFDVQVDGEREVFEAKVDLPLQMSWPHPLDKNRHHLTIRKRSEASAGHVVFKGISLGAKGKLYTPAPPKYRLNIMFFGDSITAGACNEDGPADQWLTYRTHNSNKSYAALLADSLQADLQNISVSGMGIVTGYVPVRAGEVWDRLYPIATSSRADLTTWKPDVIFVNYGDNDTSFTVGHGQPFPPAFSDGYVALIHAIRQAYPSAQIVLLRGGMSACAENLDLRAAWNTAVQRLEADDRLISHYVFKHYTVLHPRVADDQIMADELQTWLKDKGFKKSNAN